jgi:hypothetical protein
LTTASTSSRRGATGLDLVLCAATRTGITTDINAAAIRIAICIRFVLIVILLYLHCDPTESSSRVLHIAKT